MSSKKFALNKHNSHQRGAHRSRAIGLIVFALVFGIVGYWLLNNSQAATVVKGDASTSTVEQRLLSDPNVLWVGTADSATSWKTPFGLAGEGQSQNVTQMTPSSPWKGKALRIVHPGPGHPDAGDGRWGYDARNTFAKMGVPAVSEAYLRYYVWIPDNLSRQGKMPGLQGQKGDIWGPALGARGESGVDDFGTRTMWKWVDSNPNKIGMITYLGVLWANGAPKPDGYSVSVRYKDSNGNPMLLNKGAWNHVEMRVKLNTPGQRNGVYEGWINGKKGVSLTDVEYRSVSDLLINQWNLVTFWGGPPEDYPTERTEFFYDDFVVSRSYVGPRDDASTSPPTPPTPSVAPDLVVTDVSWSPANPAPGQAITFKATIKNQGNGSSPDDIIHGVRFDVGSNMTWSDTHLSSLAPGETVTLTANGGLDASSWTPTAAGDFQVTAYVDDRNRITGESDETNNKLTQTVTVSTSTTPPSPTFSLEDINQDGLVNLQDFSILASNFGKSSGLTNPRADINSDGTVNLQDFSLLAAKFGA